MAPYWDGNAQPEARRTIEKYDDAALLDGIAQRRDTACYAELYSRYEERAYHLALHMTGKRELAQDAVQMAMLVVWMRAPICHSGNVAGWIMRIVANKSLSLTRRRSREVNRRLRCAVQEVPLRNSTPSDSTDQGELLQLLREALRGLPAPESQVLALHYAGGLTQSQIGIALGISQKSVSYRLANAYGRLRAYLAQGGYSTVLPLVSPQKLGEAYASGFDVPPELRERVLEGVARASREGRRKLAQWSVRTGAVQAGGPGWLAAGLGLPVAAMGVLTLALFQPHGDHRWPGETQQNRGAETFGAIPGPGHGAAREASAARPFFRRWTFEKGPPGDIEVRDGSWRWDGKKGMRSAGCAVLLPAPPPGNPFLLQTRLVSLGTGQSGALWTDGVRVLSYRLFVDGNSVSTPGKMTVCREYFIGSHGIGFRDDKMVGIIEKAESTSACSLLWVLNRRLVEEIVIKTLEEDEIPTNLKEPRSLIAKLGWPVQVVGTQALPPRSGVQH